MIYIMYFDVITHFRPTYIWPKYKKLEENIPNINSKDP